MAKFGATVRELGTSQLRHITGEWENYEAMRQELLDDGFMVCWAWQVETEVMI